MNGPSIAGRIALVTGANRGIGRSLTRSLVARGAARVYSAARHRDSLAGLVLELGERIVPLTLDVTRPEHVTAAAERAHDLDLLVNNAGVAELGGQWADAGLYDAAKRELDVNLGGTIRMTQAFAPVLARHGGGTLVNIVSIAGLSSVPLFISYSLSKAALHSFTQSTRLALRPQHTAVVGVYPGPVDTDMAAGLPFEKTHPDRVAAAILDGIESGAEETFPDPMSLAMGTTFHEDPRALERQVAAMMAA